MATAYVQCSDIIKTGSAEAKTEAEAETKTGRVETQTETETNHAETRRDQE